MSTDANRASSSHFPPLSPISTVAEAGVCTHCGTALRGSYHVINETVACAKCRYAAEEKQASGGFGRALLYGIGAAIVGAIGYYLFVSLTGLEWGLITALVGVGVGQAVRIGSRSQGGRKFQLLAVVLAYLAMGGAYLPLGVKEFAKGWSQGAAADERAAAVHAPDASTASTASREQAAAGESNASGDAANASDDSTALTTPATSSRALASAKGRKPQVNGGILALGFAAIVLAGILALFAMPILVALGSPISGLIMVFALIRAWRQNVGVATEQVRVAGPFRLGTPPA